MSQFFTSLVRTVVPMVVGYIATLLTTHHIEITDADRANLASVLELLFGIAYYAGVRLLEHWRPQFGWLLGIAKKPVYVPSKVDPVV